jgi:membrane-bound metal-dependent hydrolase YbcI (DUF457 family)
MSSLVGHMLAGCAAAGAVRSGLPREKFRSVAAAAVLLAVLPDLDVLAAMVPGGGVEHRGISHTPLLLIAAALLAALLLAKLRSVPFRAGAAALLLAALTHPLLDCLMGCGAAVHFFEPFSSWGCLFPIRLLPTAYYPKTPGGVLEILLLSRTYIGVLLELAIFLPLLLLSNPSRTLRPAALVLTSCAALALSVVIYN